jgi:hypothetical protein
MADNDGPDPADVAIQAAREAQSFADAAKGHADRAESASNNAQASANEASSSDAAELAELRRSIASIEVEVAQLRPALQATSRQAVTSRQVPLTPPYVARAVIAVEDHLADMERFAETGDEMAAQQAKVAAAMRCCGTLRRLCDDDDFLEMLVTMGRYARMPDSTVDAGNLLPATELDAAGREPEISDRIRRPQFRETEIQLLQLAGLPEILAQTHIDMAITEYQEHPFRALIRLQDPMTFLHDLRQLRDASCLTADSLSQSLRERRTRQRLKKLLTFGLSGILIVTANGIGTAILGPGGAAASGAIGSAAVGIAVQILS